MAGNYSAAESPVNECPTNKRIALHLRSIRLREADFTIR